MAKKTFTAPTAALAACLLAIALVGCVGGPIAGASGVPVAPPNGSLGQSSGEPAQTPFGPPVQISLPPEATTVPSPAVSTPVSGAGSSGTYSVSITMADNGKTVRVAVGQILAVSLSDAVRWSLKVSDGNVLRQFGAPIPTNPTLYQGFYQAVGAGTSTLVGAGRPVCSGTGLCAMFVLGFTVTIVVS